MRKKIYRKSGIGIIEEDKMTRLIHGFIYEQMANI